MNPIAPEKSRRTKRKLSLTPYSITKIIEDAPLRQASEAPEHKDPVNGLNEP